MRNLIQADTYFILSTGRTGTTFLNDLLLHYYPELGCFQEPCYGNWLFNIYSNLYVLGWMKERTLSFAKQHFLYTRNKLVQNLSGNQYIEINPSLYGLGKMLKEVSGEIKILHMVRHPFTYIPSMLNFRPSAWRAHLVDLPLWNLNVSKALPEKKIQWHGLSRIEKKAWNWVYVNQTIQCYKNISKKFLVVRYEDLFSQDDAIREKTFTEIVHFLGLPMPAAFDVSRFNHRVNPSQRNDIPPWSRWDEKTLASVCDICGDLMSDYAYTHYELSRYLNKAATALTPSVHDSFLLS
jgi:hypothetical protein